MRARRFVFSLCGLAAIGVVACVTVNIYFPAPEVREAAEEIVEETWGDAAGKTSTLGLPWSSLRVLACATAWLGPAPAYAAPKPAAKKPADVNVSTAAIRALKDAIKERSPALKPYLASGAVGIGNDGMLEMRDLATLDLAGKATVRRLVEAENNDRAALYREIALANEFGEDRIKDVQAIFAETWAKKAEKGWWVEQKDGSWAQR